jgi:dihydroorotate dehydrogenase (NAD+) catalytic subunit
VAGARGTLAVDLGGGLQLPTPVMVASGCFGRELAHLMDPRKLGGIVTRSLTVQPQRGSATPRMAETASGLLSDTGLQNEGVESFRATELPVLTRIGIPVLMSIAGTSVEEFVRLTVAADTSRGVAGVEVNACSPSRERGGRWFSSSPEAAAEVSGAVSRLTRLPVFVKLSANTANLAATAEACVRAGAHGLTLIHSLPGMAVDPETFHPKLAAVTGGLSGPALHPIAVRAVHEVSTALPKAPILGVGGICTAEDAIEMLLAGAWAVQVGTALFSNPIAAIEVTEGIASFLRRKRLSSPAELRGKMSPRPVVPEREEP